MVEETTLDKAEGDPKDGLHQYEVSFRIRLRADNEEEAERKVGMMREDLPFELDREWVVKLTETPSLRVVR